MEDLKAHNIYFFTVCLLAGVLNKLRLTKLSKGCVYHDRAKALFQQVLQELWSRDPSCLARLTGIHPKLAGRVYTCILYIGFTILPYHHPMVKCATAAPDQKQFLTKLLLIKYLEDRAVKLCNPRVIFRLLDG